MKRRKFVQKVMLASGAILATEASAFSAFIRLNKEQNFDFMNTSHPNLKLIHDFFQAYANKDSKGIENVLSDKIQWHIPGEHPLSGTKNGIEEVMAFFQKLTKGSFQAEPIVMGVNDTYVIDCHKNWSNLEGQENLNSMSCLLWKIENNKIVEVHNFPENQKDVNQFFNKLYGE